MNANQLTHVIGENNNGEEVVITLRKPLYLESFVRQQQAEIEDLKNANRFIQNFAEEQHQRAVGLEMRELTDEEIEEVAKPYCDLQNWVVDKHEFARAILKKASENV